MHDVFIIHLLTWLGIAFCISQSAMFSGLNLALLGVSRMRLEIEASGGNVDAGRILKMRKDSNFLLTTILWGNVGINVFLTLLANSVLAGVSAFFFSTVIITFLGEITPQAYFSRHAMKMGGLLAPVLQLYQYLLYPVAKPTAKLLDMWLGKEAIHYYAESDLRTLLKKHIAASNTDIDRLEGIGALNFLAMDDIMVAQVGEPLDPQSIVALPFENDRPVFPAVRWNRDDPFLRRVNVSGKKWVVLTDLQGEPNWVLNANAFLRDGYFYPKPINFTAYCHRPIIVRDTRVLLGSVLSQLKVNPKDKTDNVIDNDLILVWSEEQKRIITGADILGRLMHGIAQRERIDLSDKQST
jgi:metal transporter CNNM